MNADGYVRKVEVALRDLPWSQRRDLVAELRGHLADFPAGTDLEARLGTPEQYAADLRAAAGLERRRGPIAYLRARRPRNVALVFLALILAALIAVGVTWVQSYAPIGYAGGGILPPGAVRHRLNIETIQFRKGGHFRLGVPIANDGRFAVRVLGLGGLSNGNNGRVYNPPLMFSYRLRMSPPSKTWDYQTGPYEPFHPFDLQPGEATMIVVDGTFAKTCAPFEPGDATDLEPTGFLFRDGEIPIRFHFLWKTSTALVPPFWGILEIVFPKGCR